VIGLESADNSTLAGKKTINPTRVAVSLVDSPTDDSDDDSSSNKVTRDQTAGMSLPTVCVSACLPAYVCVCLSAPDATTPGTILPRALYCSDRHYSSRYCFGRYTAPGATDLGTTAYVPITYYLLPTGSDSDIDSGDDSPLSGKKKPSRVKEDWLKDSEEDMPLDEVKRNQTSGMSVPACSERYSALCAILLLGLYCSGRYTAPGATDPGAPGAILLRALYCYERYAVP
jgi:hypothetical protein